MAADRSGAREPGRAGRRASITLFQPLVSARFAAYEKVLLVVNVFVALAGLGYALLLVKQVRKAPQGTPRMQEIAQAVREGANAYLYRQFRIVGVLIVLITVGLFLIAKVTHAAPAIAWGRSIAFLLGSTFSATVGVRRHAAGDHRQSARGDGGPVKLRPRAATGLPDRDHPRG